MEKMAVIGLDADRHSIIKGLMKLGATEITNYSAEDIQKYGDINKDGDDELISRLEARINKTGVAIETLEKYSKEKEPLFITRKRVRSEDFYEKLGDEKAIRSDISRVMKLGNYLHKTLDKINKEKSDLLALKPWEQYDVDLDVHETKNVIVELGVIPATVDVDALINDISEISDLLFLKKVNSDRELHYVVYVSHKEAEEAGMDFLKKYGFSPIPFKEFEGTVTENIARISADIEIKEKKVKDLEESISALVDKKEGIQYLYDRRVIERDEERARQKILKTERTFMFEAWVPVPAKKKVVKLLDENKCHYDFREPKEDENVPVLVKNNSFITPFESIMDMYSLPDYRGIDATGFFWLSYAIFFGMMLSDAGYGMILAGACFIVLKKFDLEGMMYKMVKTFMWCGVSTIFWGLMFGGWFGDMISVVAKTFFNANISLPAIWFNPLDDPTRLLIWSLIFGVIHIFLGMGINAYMLIKRGKWLDAVFDIFSWYMLILGAIGFAVGDTISPTVTSIGKYVAIAGAVIILLTGGRAKKGIGKVTGGLGALYGVTGYISDILSYSRLLALGLATGVIASVVNTMGSMFGNGILGIVLMIVIGVVGHIFNMAINVLGAFVHSSRLQYIEFFGKFYEDGGEEFEPLERNTKYVRIIDNEV